MRRTVLAFTTAALAFTLVGCGLNPAGMPGASSQAFQAGASAKKAQKGLGLKTDGLKKLTGEGAKGEMASMAALPATADLRAGCSPISDQGNTNACVGFATVDGLGEYLARKQGRAVDLAPRFIWNMGRDEEDSLGENVGMLPRTAMKIADNIGMAPESAFPFPTVGQMKSEESLMKLVSEKPSSVVIKEAKRYRLFKGWKPVTSVHAMKKAVSEGLPVVFGIAVFPSIFETGKDGMIPLPKANEEFQGGHAIVCVGYDNAKRRFIIRNSWGTAWGDKGYGYLPYEFVSKGLAWEGYTVKL